MKQNNKEKPLTVLGKETVFDGLLKFTEDLYIMGHFSGSIDAQGSLVIGKDAVCRTQYIKAASIVVEGTVHGSLTAADKVEMKKGCAVYGNITASRIKIADDVLFEGTVKMVQEVNLTENSFFTMQSDQLREQLRNTQI